MKPRIEDETYNFSKIREQRIFSYFDQGADKQLQILNKQHDDTASCWCDLSHRSIAQNIQHSQVQIQDQRELSFDMLQEIPTQKAQEDNTKDNFLRQKSHSVQPQLKNSYTSLKQLHKIKVNKGILLQRDTSNQSLSKGNFNRSLFLDAKSSDQEQINTVQTFQNFKTQISQRQKPQSEVTNYLTKIDFRLVSFLKLKVQRYINKYTIQGRTKLLNLQIREEINDLCDNHQIQSHLKDIRLISFILKVFGKLQYFTRFPQIDPQRNSGFIIKLSFAVFNCVFLYFFSLILIFQAFEISSRRVLLLITRLIWCIEMFSKVNTLSYPNSTNLQSKTHQFYEYIRTSFFFDFLPIIFVRESDSLTVFDYVLSSIVFIKLVNIFQDNKFIQKRIYMKIKCYYILQLINLIFKLFLIAHIIACGWYMLGVAEQKLLDQQTWYNDGRIALDQGYWWQYYVWSIYWSLTLMTTGSNVSTSFLQAFFTSIIMLFTTIVFGYILNVIGIILSERDETLRKYRKDVNVINEYMRHRNVSQSLQAKVNMNLENYYHNNFKQIQKENQVALDKISSELQNQLLRESNKHTISKIQFFSKNFSTAVLDELALFVKEEYYLPNQILNNQTLECDLCVMFVSSGSIEVIRSQTSENQIIQSSKLIMVNHIYGEIGFFTGLKSDVVLQSKEFTKILKIKRNDFIQIIKSKEKDYEVFCQIRDKMAMYQQYEDIGLNCRICNSSTHLTNYCVNAHFNRDIYIERVRWQGSRTQSRQKPSSIHKLEKFKSLMEMKLIQEKARNISNLIEYLPSSQRLQFHLSETSDSSDRDQAESSAKYIENVNNNNIEIQSKKTFEKSQTLSKGEYYLYTQNSQLTHDNPQKVKYEPPSILSQSQHQNQNANERNENELEQIIPSENIKAQMKDLQELTSSSKVGSDSVKLSKIKMINEMRSMLKKEISDRELPSFILEAATNNFRESNESDRAQCNIKRRVSINKKSLHKNKAVQIMTDNDILECLQAKPDYKKSALSQIGGGQLSRLDYYDNFMTYKNNIFDTDDFHAHFFLWGFDEMKDFKYYFPYGNSKFQLLLLQKQNKKKFKLVKQKKQKMFLVSSIRQKASC